MADIITFGPPGSTSPETVTDPSEIPVSIDGVWITAAKEAMKNKALWGALLFVDEDGETRAVWINTDRPSFRGLIEEVRDELVLQLRESLE